MGSSKTVDFLIIGQGLAGTILGWQCLLSGYSFVIVDPDSGHNASLVAAGLVDPISGQRFFQAWHADVVLPYARAFYFKIEAMTQSSFFHLKPNIRYFQDDQEAQLWESKRDSPKVVPYFTSAAKTYFPHLGPTPSLGIEVAQSAHLDTPYFLTLSRQYFTQRAALITDMVQYGDLKLDMGSVFWQGIRAKKTVFCEGWIVKDNPWFSWLPLNHSKGNVLVLDAPLFPRTHTLHFGKWMVPFSGTQFRYGATYDKNFTDVSPDSLAKEALLSHFHSRFSAPFDVVGHLAGIRPIALDNKPIIGPHPHYPNLIIFNTLGSRGVSLAPYYSQQLLASLISSSLLDREVDIRRYLRYFF